MFETEAFAAHITARVRGMQAHLLSTSELDALLERGDMQAIIDALLDSPYEHELAESLSRYEGVDAVEDAVSRNLVATFAKLRRVCGGGFKELGKIFVGRWDLIAVKSLLRNRHHQLDADTGAQTLFPGPSLPVPLMQELAGKNSMEALVQGLAAWNTRMCRRLVDSVADYQGTNQLSILEEALDQGYFLDSMRRLNGAEDDRGVYVRKLLRMEIDRINLRILFAPKAEGTSPEDVLERVVPRGILSDTVLQGMASAPTPERALQVLENTRYAHLAEGVAESVATGRFSQLDRQFETSIMGNLKRATQQRSMGIASVMSYGWLKYNEVINIRIIARGASVHLSQDRIRSEVLYV